LPEITVKRATLLNNIYIEKRPTFGQVISSQTGRLNMVFKQHTGIGPGLLNNTGNVTALWEVQKASDYKKVSETVDKVTKAKSRQSQLEECNSVD
jgi:hypothetical protein